MKFSKKNRPNAKILKKHDKSKWSGRVTAKTDSRTNVLTKQLRDFGKVGGIIDKRIGVKGAVTTTADAALRRHIIEKLRQMESFGSVIPGDDDPITRVASSGKRLGKRASFDDDLGGLSADIVDSELFAGGLFTERQSNEGAEHGIAGQDALLDKIAATKEERLKRVEENEEQRKKLKNADIEWAEKVRFMLERISGLKPRNTKAAAKLEKSRTEVFSLLNKLSAMKTVAPIGAKVETEKERIDKLFGNLESIISRKINMSDESAVLPKESRCEDLLLRLLCEIPSYKVDTVGCIASKLRSLPLKNIAEAVRGLLLTNILINDIQSKLMPALDRPIDKFNRSDRLVGIFIPEIVHLLTRLFFTARKSEEGSTLCPSNSELTDPHLLRVDTPMKFEISRSNLDVRIGTGDLPVQEEDEPLYRLLCLHRLAILSLTISRLYSSNFPASAVLQLFAPMMSILGQGSSNLPLTLIPGEVREVLIELADSLQRLKTEPTPPSIIAPNKISLLLADKTASAQTLQRAGLVPQLEPRFDEKLDARRPKKRAGDVEIRQQLAKEKRGAMKELRKDAQFLANFDLKKIKASDEVRKKKTQAIISSMRSID